LKTHGQELETDYPYHAKTSTCKYSAAKGKVNSLSYGHVQNRSSAALKASVFNQPTCVSVCAEDNQFMYYNSGILNTKTCCTSLDHAVTAVGYGTESGQNYFIVRNSWSATWGEQGYIRMSADVGGAGVCGLFLDSNFPSSN
jgi:cathepsin L